MPTEDTIADVMLGKISHDLGEARIACTAAASQVWFCQICANILDEKRTALITTIATDPPKRNAIAICLDCLESTIHSKLKNTVTKYNCRITIETWAGTEKLGGQS